MAISLFLCLAGVRLAVWGVRYYLSVHPPKPSPSQRTAPQVLQQRRDLAWLRNRYLADQISVEDFEVEVGRVLAAGA